MPDLSQRPARYATALIATVVIGGTLYGTSDLHVDSVSQVSSLQEENAALRKQLAAAKDAASKAGHVGTRSCAEFPNQEAAQAVFIANPALFPDWDGNDNGVACEQLKKAKPDIVTVSRVQKQSPATGSSTSTPSRTSGTAGSPFTTTRAIGSSGGSSAAPHVGTRSCAEFPNQEAAQAVFAASPATYPDWDGNENGVACEQLKSAKPAPTTIVYRAAAAGEPTAPSSETPVTPVVKPTAPPKSTIVASRQHFGLYAATQEEYDSVEASTAKDSTIHGYFQGWDTTFRPERVNSAWTAGEIPMLTWESRALAGGEADKVDYSLDTIVAGGHDDYIRQYAKDITANGLPLVIRFDHEMNGDWYRWSEVNPAFGNSKGSYIAAWRHIHDIFEQQGANNLVIWDWSPNRAENLHNWPSIDDYYPGAAYVDWVGMTGYYRSGKDSTTFDATYAKTLTALRSVAPGKPIILSEVGATEDGGHKVSWIQNFFNGLQRNRDVIGFVWFNYAVSDRGNTNDWRIQSTTKSLDAFRDGIYRAGFGRDHGKAPVLVTAAPTPAPALATLLAAAPLPSSSPAPTVLPTPQSTPTPSPNPVGAAASTPTPTPFPTTTTPAPSPPPTSPLAP